MVKEYDTKKIRKISLELSEDEVKELKAAVEKPIVFDDDCPEITIEQAKRFKRVNPPKEKA